MIDFHGKVAFITGGAMGNGEGIAEVYLKYGATVIIADISDKVFETADMLNGKVGEIIGYQVDITDKQQINSCVTDVISRFGKIDILVNNAGVARIRKFTEMSDELRDFHFDVNFKGAWNTTKAIIPGMLKNGYGKIVNMSSVTGPMVADPGETAYAASKAALVGFTKALAVEFAPEINVNAVCPGYVLTPMVEHSAYESNPDNPQSVIDGIAAGVPLGRLGKTTELGELVAFLSSDNASYITGASIVFDGGSSVRETNTMGIK